jgi:hypothetical protein
MNVVNEYGASVSIKVAVK